MKQKVNLLFFVALMVILNSCILTKKGKEEFLFKNCKDSIVNITKDTTIFKDSITYKFISGPIQYLENPCKLLCDSLGNLKKFEIVKKKNGLKSTIKSVGNSIAFDCDADSLKDIIKTITHERDVYRASAVSVKIPCDRDHVDGWDYFWIKSSYILWSILIIFVLLKCFKGYLTGVFPFLAKFL